MRKGIYRAVTATLAVLILNASGALAQVRSPSWDPFPCNKCTPSTPPPLGSCPPETSLSAAKIQKTIMHGQTHTYSFTTPSGVEGGQIAWANYPPLGGSTPLEVTLSNTPGGSVPLSCTGTAVVGSLNYGVGASSPTRCSPLQPNTTYYITVTATNCTAGVCGYTLQNFCGGCTAGSNGTCTSMAPGELTTQCPPAAGLGSRVDSTISTGQIHSYAFTTGPEVSSVYTFSWSNFPKLGGPADLQVAISNKLGVTTGPPQCAGEAVIGSMSFAVGTGTSKTCNLLPNTTYYVNLKALACAGTCGYTTGLFCSTCTAGSNGTCTSTAPG